MANLTDPQKEDVRRWAAEGVSLAEIQRQLEETHGIRLSYLEARLLVSELEVSLQHKANEPEKILSKAAPPAAEHSPDDGLEDEDDFSEELPPSLGGSANVSVSVDSIAQPHALVSGKVTFSDGKKASWYVDQMGRLGLNAAEPGYRPSQQDLLAFQQELQRTMRRGGY